MSEKFRADFPARIGERASPLGRSEPAAQGLLLRVQLRQARGAVLRQRLLAQIAVDLRQPLERFVPAGRGAVRLLEFDPRPIRLAGLSQNIGEVTLGGAAVLVVL